MPPRLRLQTHYQFFARASKSRPYSKLHNSLVIRPAQLRRFSDAKDDLKKEQDVDAKDAAPHVSEEAAQLSKAMGETGPDLEQGTPVEKIDINEQVVEGDKKAQEKLPKVMKEGLKQNDAPKGSRSFSTSTRRGAVDLQVSATADISLEPVVNPGHKFELPTLPLPPHSHLRSRNDEVVNQFTKLIMRDGKLSKAQSHMSIILNHLRTSPPPSISSSRPLLPNAPPPSHLPMFPILYLTLALDSIAPLFRIQSLKGAAGGGIALQVPAPMTLRQRRRQAIVWIIDAVAKKQGGTSGFAKLVGEEIVAVVEGRSSVWEKRNAVHRLAITSRANLAALGRRKR